MSTMRKLKLFALAIATLLMVSWVFASNAQESAYFTASDVRFGAMVFGAPDTLSKKKAVLDSMSLTMTRENQLSTTWKGYSSRLQYWQNNGISVMLNLNFLTQGGVPFPTGEDLQRYLEVEDDLLSKYSVEYLVIENEEQNRSYHIGSVTVDYIAQLTRAIDIAHQHGVKITNGGLSTKPLRDLTYRYKLKTDSAAAQKFLQECIPDAERKALISRTSKTLESQLNETEWLLNYYSLIDLDAINLHLYFPLINRVGKGAATTDSIPNDLAGLTDIVEYVKSVTHKPVITNETGLVTKDYNLSFNLAKALSLSGMSHVCYWSGGKGSKGSFHKDSGELTKNGKGLRDFIRL